MDKRKLISKKDYFNIYKLYTEDYGKDNENFELIDKAISLLKQRNMSSDLVIDLGSGPGNVVDYLYKYDIKNIIAVDYLSEFVIFLKDKYKAIPSIQIKNEDMTDFLKNNPDDNNGLIVASYSLIHIPDEEIDELLQNIYRSLKPQGLFVFSVFKGTNKGLEIEPYQLQKDPRLKTDTKLEVYMNYFTEDEIRSRLGKVGFKILDLKFFPPYKDLTDFPAEKIWVLAEKP